MDAKGILMHIDRPDEIAVAAKPAGATSPGASCGLVLVTASGTPARCASFRASEAQDVALRGFVGEVVDVAPVLPLRQTPIVMPPTCAGTHTVRVADEERPHAVRDAKVDNCPRGFVSQVTDPSLRPSADRVPGPLQLLPALRMLLTARLLFGKPTELLAALSLERADPPPRDDERLARAGGDGGQVNLSQVDRGLHGARSVCRLRNLQADMQLEAVIPDQRTGSTVLWKIQGQDQGCPASAHRQHYAPLLLRDGLGGPVDGVEPFRAPGIFHAHLRVFFAEFSGGLDGAEEGTEHGLHRLAMQGEAPFGEEVQLVLVGPSGMAHPGLLVGLDADVPHLGRLYLRRLQAAEEG